MPLPSDSLLPRRIASHLFATLIILLYAFSANAGDTTVSHGISMYGDLKYPPDFERFDYTSSKAIKGGRLKLAAQGTFDSLNSFITKGNPADELGLIYETLAVGSADEAFSMYGLVADRIEWPEDRSWVIYHIRKEARFHDGHPITADDVVFTFNLLMKEGAPFYRAYYHDVKNVVALSPQQVKFVFKDTNNREMALVVGQLPILPKHFWETRDFNTSSLEIPLGSGPYRVKSADPGRSIAYERVKDYWAANLPVNRGLYNYDSVRIDYYKDSVVMLEALKAGLYDIRIENFSKQWATGYTGKAIDKGLLIKKGVPHQNPTGMQAFVMNLRRPLFQDIRVRQALTYAFDFEWTNKNLFYGLYARTKSYFSNSELASSGPLAGRERELLLPYKDQLSTALFTDTFTLPVSDGSGHNRANLRKAMQLLKEAGWQVVDNQLINKDSGQKFSFEILSYDSSYIRIYNPYARALKKLGIEVSVREVDTSQYINRLRSFDFDMVTSGFGQSLSPGNEQREYWSSAAADQPGSRNLAGIKSPVIDELVNSLINAPDRQELIHRTRALDRALLFNYYTIPQWYSDRHRVAYWNKFSQPATPPKYDSTFDINLFSWWIDPDKAAALKAAKKALN